MIYKGKQSKRVLSLLLSLMMILMMLPITPMTAFAASTEGYNGTPVTPTKITSGNYAAFGLTADNWNNYNGYYGIRNASELYGFANLVNSGNNRINGVLLQDIVINETVSASGATYSWTPIGNDDRPYLGTFDGNGCTISGLYINGSGTYIGLFGVAGYRTTNTSEGTAVIKNVILSNSYIRGSQNVAGIVGCLAGNFVTVSNCTITQDVYIYATHSSEPLVGGFSGGFGAREIGIDQRCTVINCVSLATIQALNATDYVGAVVGYWRGKQNAAEAVVCDNCYYLDGRTTNKDGSVQGGTGGYSDTNHWCTALSSVNDSHTCISVNHKEVKATCQYPGRSAYSECLICGEVTSGSKTDYDIVGHGFTTATCTTPATCIYCGLISGGKDASNHASSGTAYQLNGADDKKHDQYHTCCKAIIKTEKHNFSGTTCTICGYRCIHSEMNAGKCTNCGLEGTLYLKPVWNEETQTIEYNRELSASIPKTFADGDTLSDGWYIVKGNQSIYAFDTSGTVNLILADGAYLEVKVRVAVPNGSTLNIYAQSSDPSVMGKMTVTSPRSTLDSALGGGYKKAAGTINIYGGVINASAAGTGAGIGRGADGTRGYLTVHGGIVTASSINVSSMTVNGGIILSSSTSGTVNQTNGLYFSGDNGVICGELYTLPHNWTLPSGKTLTINEGETLVVPAGVTLTVEGTVINNGTIKKYGTIICKSGHSYSSDCDEDCNVCEETRIGDFAHNWTGAGTCAERKMCDRCGVIDEHAPHDESLSFDADGFCANGCYEPAVDSDGNGYVEIDNPGKLFWFAQQINNGNTGLNGILTADINLGNREWTPIGTADAKFTGTFDGNGRSITGFKITATAVGVYGLFGYIQNATVKNFSIDGSVTVNQPEKMDFYFGVVGSAHADAGKNVIIDDVISDIDVSVLDSNMKNSVAGIVGTASAATGTSSSWDGWGRVYVRKCAYTGSINMGNATVDCGGGIIGYVGYNIAAYIENNLYAGSFTGPGGQVGGIVGYNNGKNMNVVNCLSIGALNLTDSYFVGAIGGRYINQINDKVDSLVKNNYYTGDLPAFSNNPDATNDLVDLGNFDGGNALNVTTEQVKSGEIAIRLGSAWGQTMGSQEHPVPNGQKVYQVSHCGKTVYSNTNSSWDHAYDSEGFCTKTEGETHYQPAQLVDGYYQITNPGNLYWFAWFVNDGNYNANAVLTTDLNLGGREWYTICSTDLYYQTTAYSSAVYTGTFDGANHVISNYVVKGTTGVKCSVGLFGTAYGATIKNLGVDNMTFQLNGATDVRAAAIVGQMLDGTLVENCYVINSDLTPGQFIVGGVAACNYAGTIRNCYTYNVKISANERCGNLVSDIRGDIDKNDRPGAVINCYTDAAWVTGSQKSESKPLVNCQDGVAASRFASGEIAYLLSQGENGGVWGQTIGTESLPVLNGAKVYELKDCGGSVVGYSNTDSGVSHSYGEPTFAWSADYSACRAVFTCQLDATHRETVDCTVSVDSTDPSKTVYTATVTVNGKTYTDVKEVPNEVISVEITWTAMEFTYTDGEWQPESHSYADGKWTPDAEDGGVITVKNTGNKDVSVTFGYTKTVDEVEGGFADENETAITSPVALAAGEEKKIKLVLSGKPSSTLENANLGSVTVTITLPEEEES